ncbi:MAG: carboxypeptidase regulatory-like protein [Planctomycetaceae bacterium]|nr:carboxypeptidase regulatory-like protein [Planctomycetaceae bacterium]
MQRKLSGILILRMSLFLLPLAVGCSGGDTTKARPLAASKGVVKYNGQPIAGATVLFSPAAGSPATGMTDKDGNFTVTTGGRPGAEVGKFKVIVTKPLANELGKTPTQMKPEDMQKMATEGKSFAPPKSEFPARYTSLETTTLEADVSADAKKNVFEFNLVD